MMNSNIDLIAEDAFVFTGEDGSYVSVIPEDNGAVSFDIHDGTADSSRSQSVTLSAKEKAVLKMLLNTL